MTLWDQGSAYESFMGRWSRQIARRFVDQAATDPGLRWLDVGCGTGALTEAILDAARPSQLSGVDSSQGFIDIARVALADRADLHLADGDDLPFDDDTFDVVVSGLALNFMPDPALALDEWRRVTRPGGTVGVYVWDYAGRMGFLRSFWDAVSDLDPVGAAENDQGERFPICQPDALRETFDRVGLTGVEVGDIEIVTVFADFDDYWGPFLSGVGPAGAYLASIDEVERDRIADRLRASLPVSAGGEIELPARAWTAFGTV